MPPARRSRRLQGPQDRRPADQARGRGAEGVRPGGLRHRHQGAGHGARPHDPPGGRRRGAGQGRRKLDQGHPGRPGGAPERASSPWSRRKRVGRHPGDARSSRSSGRRSSRRSRTRPRSTTTSARRRCASARSRQDRPATSTRRSRPRRKVIEAEYEWPFQSHAAMGPACALVEIKDGKVDLLERHAEDRTSCSMASPRMLGVPLETCT